jgi:hypothetical protein
MTPEDGRRPTVEATCLQVADYIRVGDELWALPKAMTVAMWRQRDPKVPARDHPQ